MYIESHPRVYFRFATLPSISLSRRSCVSAPKRRSRPSRERSAKSNEIISFTDPPSLKLCHIKSLQKHRGQGRDFHMFRAIPLPFIFLRTLLRFSASPQNATPFVSDSSALFAKNHPGWGVPQRSTSKRSNVQTFKRSNTFPPSHCSAKPLVQQFAKARDFFTTRGNNSAPPGV